MTEFRPFSPEQVALLEHCPHPVLVLDAEYRIRFLNAATGRMGGVKLESLVGAHVWTQYPELEGSIFHRAYATVMADGRAQSFEEYRADADRWVSVVAYPCEGGVVAMLEDITSRRLAERQLLESQQALARAEETLRLAQDAANVGSFERDLATGHTVYSPTLLRILGIDPATYDPHRPSNDPRHDFVHPDDRDAFRAAFVRVLETGEKSSMRIRSIRGDGELRHLITSAMVVRDDQGRPSRMVGTAFDITEQTRADEERSRFEMQMQQAQKLESLGVLAGGIAHDFNNLLVGILGNASLALLDLGHDADARRSVEEIEQAAQRAAELTRQLLAYAGKGRFVVESVDASRIVHEMATLLRTAVSKRAAVQLDLPDSLPLIEVDATQFRQVVMNLITNASDAISEGPGAIVIRTGRETLTEESLRRCVPGTNAQPGSYVFIEVRDTGIGMDDATIARIFDPFYSTKFTGRGLGLAATLGIVRGHRGAIETISTPGEGTTMRLFFPASTSTTSVVEPPAPRTWTGSGRVLIVDDEESVRSVSGALLRRRGFETTLASDGYEALDLVRVSQDEFTLVLLDLTMPGMDGEATFHAMRELRPALRVVLMSGYNESEVTRMFEGRGIAGFLQKPFRAEEMYEVVGRSLGLRPV